MTKINQYSGAGVSRDQRRKNLLALRDAEKVRQEAESKARDAKRRAAANAERRNGGL